MTGKLPFVFLVVSLMTISGCQSTSGNSHRSTSTSPTQNKSYPNDKFTSGENARKRSQRAATDISFEQVKIDDAAIKKLAQQFDTISLSKFQLQQHSLHKTELTNEILFETGSAASYSIQSSDISAVATLFNSGRMGKNLYIVGHTDSRGKESFNLRLSLRRAMSIATKLVDKGVDVERIKLVPAGEYQPIAPNSKGSFNKNRRVDILSADSKALLSAFLREQDCRDIDPACQTVELGVIALEKIDELGVVMKTQRYDSVTVAAPGKSDLRQLSTDLRQKGAIEVDKREQKITEKVRTGIGANMIRDTFSMDVIMREPLVFKAIVREVLRFDAKHIIK